MPEPEDAAAAATTALKEQANKLKEQGNALYTARKFAKAYDMYSRAIALLPDAIFFSNRSGVALDLGRPRDAEADALACLELQPLWPKGHYRLGAALEAQARLEEALRAYDAGLLLDATHADLVAGRARLLPRLEAAARSADRKRPTFLDCVEDAALMVDPSAASDGPDLLDLVADFPRVRLEGSPGESERGRRLVAAVDMPAFSEVFTETAAFWVGPLTNRFGALTPLVAEVPPARDLDDASSSNRDHVSTRAGLEHLLLQLEPFSGEAAGNTEPLPPLTRAELFQRAIRVNGVGACFDENIMVSEC